MAKATMNKCLGTTKQHKQCQNPARHPTVNGNPAHMNRCALHRDQEVDFAEPGEKMAGTGERYSPARSRSPSRRVSFADEVYGGDTSSSDSDADSGVFIEHPRSPRSTGVSRSPSPSLKPPSGDLWGASAAHLTRRRLARNIILGEEITASQCDKIADMERVQKKIRKGTKLDLPAIISQLISRQSVADAMGARFAYQHCVALARIEELERENHVQRQQIAFLAKQVEKLLGPKHGMRFQGEDSGHHGP